ncbi:MAG: S8 family serine peptidase, partial [Methanoregulaceae archaeon]|nr:S8 family serine peptidase [Methanoregulaceae archaeon]
LPTESYSAIYIETFQWDPDMKLQLERHTSHLEQATSTRYVLDLPVWGFNEIAAMDGIEWIEPRPHIELDNDVAAGVMAVDTVWGNYGLDGSGQTGAVADTGLDTGTDDHLVNGDIHADFDNRVRFGNWAGSSPDDGYGHGTHVAGSIAGNGVSSGGAIKGMAYNASVFFQGIMDDSYNLVTPSNLSLLFRQAYDNGSRVHSNSWGADGLYGVYTSECYDVDWFMYNYPEMLILFAAGNDGWDSSPQDGKIDADSVAPPATAKSCITVGASENIRSFGGIQATYGSSWGYPQNPIKDDRPSNNSKGLAPFSGRGPMDDGRLKPDVVAPGTNILSTKTSLGGISGWGSYSNPAYLYMGGTSMSTPLTAGAALLVRQYYNKTYGTSPTGALVKATMVNGATDLTPGQYGAANPTTKEVNRRPDNDQGWGRVNLGDSVYPQGANLSFLDQRQGLRTGENITRIFRVLSGKDLRITLAWSDYPSSTFTGKQLVNDLDLVLESPDGTKYNGNDLTAPYDSSYDSLNPVEGISIKSPLAGWWKVMVNARNVAKGVQHFALIGTGDMTSFVTESMGFNRGYFSTDGSEIKLQLLSRELIGSATVTAHVNSTSYPLGRDVELTEDGNYGSFRGSLWTSNQTTSDLTRLFVSHNDTIEASYISPSSRVFSARSVAKKPLRMNIIKEPELNLIFTLGERIGLTGVGKPGTIAAVILPGTMFGPVPLYDDGSPVHNDITAGDGIFGASVQISSPMSFKTILATRVMDPFLGPLLYGQFNISANTSLPKAPRSLKASSLPYGNSVLLSWNKSSGSDIDHYSIYINGTPLLPGFGNEGWAHFKDTMGIENSSVALGLSDGTGYYFRVAAVDTNGNLSSLSVWAKAVPSDIAPPSVEFLGVPYTLAGIARLSFETDRDLELLEAEYCNDSNGNGLADDNLSFIKFYNGTSASIDWDTREEAGGPGNLESMIIRFRGYDEVPNISPWTVLPGFSVDNIGPRSIELQTFPPRITNDHDFEIIGSTEPLGKVIYEQ